MDKEEIYKIFLKNFPRFESQVKAYYDGPDPNSIKIFTKVRRSFIFVIDDNGDFSLKSL